MADLRRAPGLSAEDVTAAVRIHADRVHDFARRLGCSPEAAVEVVESSGFDLIHAVVTAPHTVGDPVGWWFGRARTLGRRAAGDQGALPVGGGILSTDEDQVLLSQALERLGEPDRVALLLRDSYALSAAAVNVALGTVGDAGMQAVGEARLAFLAAVGDADVRTATGHPLQLAVLARLGEGGPVAAADATARRHAQSCPICRSGWDGQSRAHQALAGLSVVALPEALRDPVLTRIEQQARAALPSAADLLLVDEELEEDRRGRWVGPFYAFLAVIAAILLGTVAGLLLSRSSSGGAAPAAAATTPAGASAVPSSTPALVSPALTAAPTPTSAPTTRVFLVTPTPSPSVSATRSSPASASPEPATEPLRLTLSPASGPNGTPVSVDGTGWTPGGTVTLDYLDPLGRPTGSRASTTIDARGRFTTTLAAQDPANLPGRHRVSATDGVHTSTAVFTATG